MKTKFIVISAIAVISCSTQQGSARIDTTLMEDVLKSKTYDIIINSAISYDGTKTNLMPNTTMTNGGNISTGTLPLNKDKNQGEYYIRVRPEIIAVNIPYFGKSRSSTLSYNVSEFFSKNINADNVEYNVHRDASSNSVQMTLKEKMNNVKNIFITVDKNGTALIKISKIADQTATYEGYIVN